MVDKVSRDDNDGYKIQEYKCNKKVKNGVQYNSCESVFHYKCGSFRGTRDEMKRRCPSYEDTRTRQYTY